MAPLIPMANACRAGPTGSAPRSRNWITVVVTFDELPNAGAGTLAPSSKIGFTPDELQSLNLAGLHMKQQKFKEAVEAFEKGLARYQDTTIRVNLPSNTRQEDFTKAVGESAEAIRDLHKQLATAYVNLGELKKASRSIDIAMNLKFELLTAKATEKPKPKIPAKLVISITKSEIDAAKSGEEFRKAVSIQRQGFPALKK